MNNWKFALFDGALDTFVEFRCALPLTHDVHHGLNGMCVNTCFVFSDSEGSHGMGIGSAPISTRTLSASTGPTNVSSNHTAASFAIFQLARTFAESSARLQHFCGIFSSSAPLFRNLQLVCTTFPESSARLHHFFGIFISSAPLLWNLQLVCTTFAESSARLHHFLWNLHLVCTTFGNLQLVCTTFAESSARLHHFWESSARLHHFCGIFSSSAPRFAESSARLHHVLRNLQLVCTTFSESSARLHHF